MMVLYKIALLALGLIGIWISIHLTVFAYKATRRVPGPWPIRFYLFALLLVLMLTPIVALLTAVSK